MGDADLHTTPPIVQFAINFQSEKLFDGLTLQSSVNGGSSWQTVGSASDLLWYTDNMLSSLLWAKPSNEQAVAGWSGDSGGWVVRSHALNGLQGQANARLRLCSSATWWRRAKRMPALQSIRFK